VIVDRDNDTICAVATPFGRGGISVIRVSGRRALEISKALCPFMPEKTENHRVYYGHLLENSQEIDEVMATYFRRGRSFTGEDSVEISCHGNPVICERILQALVGRGARLADRGEFTYRAFINGRIDLVQAESVLSLIESQTKESSRVALQQLKGDLSKNLEKLESDLTWSLAHIEAGIDFSTEGLEVVDQKVLVGKLEGVKKELNKLVESYQYGRLLKDGVQVALVGRPNVGKSSLLNLLVEDERAIVTEIPGTTRDVVTADTHYKKYKFSLQDTAGLRVETQDLVEKIGIQKTHSTIQSTDFIFYVIEAQRSLDKEEVEIFEKLDLSRAFILINKKDLADRDINSTVEPLFSCGNFKSLGDKNAFLKDRVLLVSSFDKNARNHIFDRLLEQIKTKENDNPVLLIQSRHFECLSKALDLVQSSLENLKSVSGPEYVALDLKQALIYLHEVLGKRFDDQIMDRVFKEFCIGK
jgi:tRNA modification GTPase